MASRTRGRPRPLGPRDSSRLNHRFTLVLGLATFLGAPLAVGLAFPESWWVERRFGLRADPAVAVAFSDEVVLVALDERYAERYDRPAETPKAYLARVVRALARHRPTCVALDFRFGPTDEGRPGFDAFVAAARDARRAGVPLVYPALVGRPGGEADVVLEPPAALAGTGHSGSVSLAVATAGPGVVASGPPTLREVPLLTALRGGRFAASLPLVAAALQRAPGLLPRGTGAVLPDSAAAERLLAGLGLGPLGGPARPALVDFAGPPFPRFGLAYLSSETLLGGAVSDSALGRALRGRVVVVAQTDARADGADLVRTPFGVFRGGTSHVYAVDTILRGGGLRPPGPAVAVLLAALLAGLVGAAWRARALVAAALSLGVAFAYVAVCFAAFAASGALIPMAWPLDAALAAATLGFLLNGSAPPRAARPAPPEPPVPARARPEGPGRPSEPAAGRALPVLGLAVAVGVLLVRAVRGTGS